MIDRVAMTWYQRAFFTGIRELTQPNANLPSNARVQRIRRVYRDVSAASIGIEMGLAVVVGWALGQWLDDRWGTQPFLMIAGLLLGAAAGFKGVFRAARQAKRALAESNE